MKKNYITLFESDVYKKTMKKYTGTKYEVPLEYNFTAANLVHMSAQKCVLDHGENGVMFNKDHDNIAFIKRILDRNLKTKKIVEDIYEESKRVNKGKFDRAIDDRVANTLFVIEEIERLEKEKSEIAPEEM